MRTFVTGCSGFIARHLIPAIIARGDSVVGLDIRPCTSDFGESFSFVRADVRDAAAVADAISGVDRIVHLAAEHADFGVPRQAYHEVNVNGTRTLLNAAADEGVRDLLFTSSVAVYGKADPPHDEDSIARPATPYGASKLAAEQVVTDWCRDGRRAVVLRPAVIHGPHNYANMYRLMSQISRGRYVHVGRGTNVKSIGYVENLVDAAFFLLDEASDGVTIYNFADGPDLSSREIVETLAAALEKPLPKATVPKAVAVALVAPMDIVAAVTRINLPITAHRIHKLTSTSRFPPDNLFQAGFQPRFTSRDGLRKSAEWFSGTESP